ncbi:MAG: hypothetical protein NTX50_21550 [Candidatus Sumerlaeota bacterium]|nr:hypothetical protein [Candidatus Sumerlaeota bacterium]
MIRLFLSFMLFLSASGLAAASSESVAIPTSATTAIPTSITSAIAASAMAIDTTSETVQNSTSETASIPTSATAAISTPTMMAISSSSPVAMITPAPASSDFAGATTGALRAAVTTDMLSFVPPLCLEDAIELTTRSAQLLSASADSLFGQRQTQARRMIALAREYCEFLDNRHSALGAYQWIRIGTQKVPARGIAENIAKAASPIPDVSAITFEAAQSDVWVWGVACKEVKGGIIPLPVESAILRNMPWSEVCYLPAPITLQEATIRSQTWGATAELTIFAGISKKREFARRAVLQLQSAEKALNEDQTAEALASLEKARGNMERFRKEKKND